MITPSDIQTVEFAKEMRGYSQQEVDKFLDDLTVDYESVLSENASLKKNIEELTSRLEEYKAQEGAVIKTLETAKSLMNDISASAEKRADILLKNAQLDAELQTRQASENVKRLKEEEEKLTKRVSNLQNRVRSILQAELDRFDDLTEDIFGTPAVSDADVSGGYTKPAEPAADAAASAYEDSDLFKTRMNIRRD